MGRRDAPHEARHGETARSRLDPRAREAAALLASARLAYRSALGAMYGLAFTATACTAPRWRASGLRRLHRVAVRHPAQRLRQGGA
jgi:hypothetical protein